MAPAEVPTTEISKAPLFRDQLYKMLIEEQRVLIAAVIACTNAIGGG